VLLADFFHSRALDPEHAVAHRALCKRLTQLT
jgi:hypothetical protein